MISFDFDSTSKFSLVLDETGTPFIWNKSWILNSWKIIKTFNTFQEAKDAYTSYKKEPENIS